MKKIVLVFVFIVAFVSCKKENKATKENTKKEKTEPLKNSNKKSILDIEYLNDSLDIAITDIKVINKENDRYDLEIVLETPAIKKYSQDHRFFVHCYYYEGMEDGEKKYMAIGTNRVKVEENKILFRRSFKSEIDIFKVMRYGLLDVKTNERLFNLKLDSIALTN